METPLPPDFKEFLRLLNSAKIEYLIVGGFAVSFHGYPRPTGDLDIWIALHPATARSMLAVIEQFGFADTGATPELLQTPNKVIRMGMPPVRIEILTSISGVEFGACHKRRVEAHLDGVPVSIISADDLRANKAAANRDKDRNDLKHLGG